MRSAAAPRPLPSLRTASGVTSGLKPKNEWIVWPRTLSAATPVGARTAMRLSVWPRQSSSRVDFPVPALPVMKTWWDVPSMMSRAWRNPGLISIVAAGGRGAMRVLFVTWAFSPKRHGDANVERRIRIDIDIDDPVMRTLGAASSSHRRPYGLFDALLYNCRS